MIVIIIMIMMMDSDTNRKVIKREERLENQRVTWN